VETGLEAQGVGMGLMVAAFLLGLRHGIDWDHIAALADIAASQEKPRTGFRLGTVYILGHAAVVMVLGVVAISLGASIPDGFDTLMGRVVGVTLIAMAVYILASLLWQGPEFRMRSRWMLAFAGVRWTYRAARRLGRRGSVVRHDHEHGAAGGLHHNGAAAAEVGVDARDTHSHSHSHSDDAFADYGTKTVLGIGVLHGVGAETPTQVVIFLAAANAGGTAAGLAVLVVFVVGLALANTGLNLASTSGFLAAGKSRFVNVAVAGTTAVASLVLGLSFLLGADSMLPALFVG